MDTHATYWPDDSTTSFDVDLVETVGMHTGRDPMELPVLGDVVDFDALAAIVRAETRTRLAFDVEVPGLGTGVDGEPATTVTVLLETGPGEPVQITVTDENREPGGVGAAPRIW